MVAEGKRASLPLAVCSERELGYIVGTVFERLLTASELLFLAYAGALSLASQNQSFEKISSYEISRVEADSDREDVILQGEFESTIENEDARICLIGKAAQAAQVAECKDDAESDDDDEDDDDDDDDAEEGDDDDDDAEEGEDDDDDDIPVNNPADDEDDEDENGNEEDDDDDDDDDDEEDEDDDEDDEEDDDEDEEPPAKKKK